MHLLGEIGTETFPQVSTANTTHPFWSTFWLFIEGKENGNLSSKGQVPRQSEREKLRKTETDASHPHTPKKTHTQTKTS